MRRTRRHVRVPPDLTSLFDVLFIVIFAVLIRGAAMQQAAAKAAEPPPPPPPPPESLEPSELHAQALAQLDAELAARPTVIARVSAAGKLIGLESGDESRQGIDARSASASDPGTSAGTRSTDRNIALDVPLLEHSPDPDVALAYLGDRSAELRVCRFVALHLGVSDLAQHLVIIAPDARGADLPHALYTGLRRDVERCLADQRGLAVIVDPGSRREPTPVHPRPGGVP